ncbi:hypothetical protein ABIF90_002167 [Bradyrhizobium japonicum]
MTEAMSVVDQKLVVGSSVATSVGPITEVSGYTA